MGTIRKVHKDKGQTYLLHMWAKVRGKWVTCGTLHSEVGWRLGFVLPRGKRPSPVLQLQHQPRGKSVYIWKEPRGRKGSRAIQTKTTNNKNVRRGLPVKDRTLYNIK